MVGENEKIYEFADFRLIPGEGLLLSNGTPIDLNPKAFSVLALLVEHHGHLISKSEIMDSIWEHAFIEEGAVSKSVWFIRNALGDTSKEKFIQTIPRRGYRFVAPVAVLNNSDSATSRSEHFSTGYRLPILPEQHDGRSELNFLEESQRSNGEIDLVSVETARDTTTVPEGKPIAFPVASRNRMSRRWVVWAGLAVVLLGGVAIYLGNRLPARSDVNEVRSESGTNNEEAYRFYLLAQNIGEERGVQNVRKALEYLEQAVKLDPNYARAWAAKAHIHRDIVGHGDPNTHEHYQKSMEALRKALAIDPNSSDAYSALCLNKNRYEYDFEGAEIACKRALDLDPKSSTAHKTYANFLYARGRFNEAIAEIKTAIALQPVSYRNQQIYGLALHYARRYGEAEAHFKRLLELNPNHSYIHGRLVRILEDQGKESEALEHLIKKETMDKTDERTIERFKYAYATSGWRGVAIERIKAAEAEAVPRSFNIACLYAQVGNNDKAFEYLEKAYQERSFLIPNLGVEPQLDPLRTDPRFADLIKRVQGK